MIRVYLWDITAGRLSWANRDVGRVSGLAFSPDGERLAAARYDDRVVVYRADTGGTVLVKAPTSSRYGDAAFPARVAFTADGRRLIANHASFQLSVWTADPGTDTNQLIAARTAEAVAAAFGFHLRAASELSRWPDTVGFRLHVSRLEQLTPPTERCRELAAQFLPTRRRAMAAAAGGMAFPPPR